MVGFEFRKRLTLKQVVAVAGQVASRIVILQELEVRRDWFDGF